LKWERAAGPARCSFADGGAGETEEEWLSHIIRRGIQAASGKFTGGWPCAFEFDVFFFDF
jgi:hypothetical protein